MSVFGSGLGGSGPSTSLLVVLQVEVRCRKGDVNTVKGTFNNAKKAFTEHTGKQVTLTLNEKDFLPDSVSSHLQHKCCCAYCSYRASNATVWRRRRASRR